MKRIGSVVDASKFVTQPRHGQETQKGQSKEKRARRDGERQFEKAKLQGWMNYG